MNVQWYFSAHLTSMNFSASLFLTHSLLQPEMGLSGNCGSFLQKMWDMREEDGIGADSGGEG